MNVISVCESGTIAQGYRDMTAVLTLDRVEISLPLPASYTGGYIGMGTGGFYNARFDDFELSYG